MKNKNLYKICLFIFFGFLLIQFNCAKERVQSNKKDIALEALLSAEREEGLTYQQSIGKRLFIHYCSSCHGATGESDGINSYNLNPTPPNLKESLKKRKEDETRKIIEYGSSSIHLSPLSPPYKYTLKKEEIDAILSYLLKGIT